MRTALLCLAAAATFATSAAAGYAISERSTAQKSGQAGDGSVEIERQAHDSAVEYVVQEFSDKPRERMQFLLYEAAIHGAMIAKGPKAIDAAATELLRAQDCAGILSKGHRTTITRDLILGLHKATPANPRWNRVITRASELPSAMTGDPCMSEDERRAAPVMESRAEPEMPHPSQEARPFRKTAVFHVVVDERMRRRARALRAIRDEPVRMRLD